MQRASPLMMQVTHRQLREGARLNTLADCLNMEYGLAVNTMDGHDFFEGVRALLVDKDNAPQWQHASAAEVPSDLVDSFFAPLPEADAHLLPFPPSA